MAESLQPDDISSLAHRLAEQIAVLCPNVPASEVSDAASRLAFTEVAHASGVAFDDHAEPETAVAPSGNRIVWLPGASASAIVLPSGEERSHVAIASGQLLAWARRHGAPLGGIASRGSAALRQVGAALVSAYQARPRVQ